MSISRTGRRGFLAGAAGTALALGLPGRKIAAKSAVMRPFPRSGELLPAIGMGSWITFNVGASARLRNARAEVLETFFSAGGTLIDSSPMYGSSEAVIGHGLGRIDTRGRLFSATKVWTPLTGQGISQMTESRRLWGLQRFDLMQVHNLVNWEDHLDTLATDKAAGKIRYIGITTSHGRRHDEFRQFMADHRVDAVQFTYNIVDREVERRLLPMAAELGQAVIINRPFRRGALFRKVAGRPLPDWAREFDCENWAQYFLKFVISHPAVTCAIPATSRVDHMRENMGALSGRLPDPKMRARMVRLIEAL
ncbi:MAG: aldo/keto reductase [Alphaproteobacteria bacterium]